MSESDAPAAPPRIPHREQRARTSYSDMLKALIIFLAAIGLFLAILPRHHQSAVKPADYSGDLAIFAHAAAFAATVPSPLPSRWTVTSFTGITDTSPQTMHMGMVTDTTTYADLEETNGPAAAWIALQTHSAALAGTETVAGVVWQRYSRKSVVSLARTADGFTTVLTGGADLADLRLLASSLRPAL